MALIKGWATDARCRFMKRPHNEFAGREVYSGVTVFAFFFFPAQVQTRSQEVADKT